MALYRQGQFAAAIPGLLAAATADPKSPDPQFFLGICYLMDGRSEEAITHLRATIELGSTLDLEMAHFYLAKALLREKETARAEGELERAIARVSKGRGVLLLTDMFGGAPTDIASMFLSDNGVEVVTGVNLPMILKLARQTAEQSLAEIAHQVRDSGKDGIHLAGELLARPAKAE